MNKNTVKKSCLIRGKTIYYWVYNHQAKKTIIAVHGLRGTHHGLQFIAQKLPDYTFIVPDLPGHGESEPLEDVHSAENFARFLDEFINKLDLEPPHFILAHSFGCTIAGQFTKNKPELVSKLILVNPVVSGGHPVGALVAKSYYKLGEVLPEYIGTGLLRSKLINRVMTFFVITTRRKRLKKRVYEQHMAHFSSFSHRRVVLETFNSTITEMLVDNAPSLNVPVLMITGHLDRLAPRSGQQALYERLPNAEHKVIGYVGHLIHYETPELAARYIKDFLENEN